MAVSIKIRGATRELSRVRSQFIKQANQGVYQESRKAVSALMRATPVDTGRARRSWNLSTGARNYVDSQISPARIPRTVRVSSTRFQPFHITNGVPYIAELNNGHSAQSPARFIEMVMARFGKLSGGVVTNSVRGVS